MSRLQSRPRSCKARHHCSKGALQDYRDLLIRESPSYFLNRIMSRNCDGSRRIASHICSVRRPLLGKWRYRKVPLPGWHCVSDFRFECLCLTKLVAIRRLNEPPRDTGRFMLKRNTDRPDRTGGRLAGAAGAPSHATSSDPSSMGNGRDRRHGFDDAERRAHPSSDV
jgi:hypothetical protein